MTFKQGIRSGLDNSMNFEERATREEFWWWALLVGLVLAATLLLSMILYFTAILGSVFLLFLALPTASIIVRRLHDLDRPGWEAVAAVVPLFGWAYLLMRFLEAGDPRPNQYGRQ